ncbi:hypothetical protein EJ110_NYTH60087 [Nymphaea thermarum]|nr:hypothetical protein EJ110_NYTH60087 [Nymphaea thermarum]
MRGRGFIFGVADQPREDLDNPNAIPNPSRFGPFLLSFLRKLAASATTDQSSPAQATGAVTYANSQTVYRLVKCARDLSPAAGFLSRLLLHRAPLHRPRQLTGLPLLGHYLLYPSAILRKQTERSTKGMKGRKRLYNLVLVAFRRMRKKGMKNSSTNPILQSVKKKLHRHLPCINPPDPAEPISTIRPRAHLSPEFSNSLDEIDLIDNGETVVMSSNYPSEDEENDGEQVDEKAEEFIARFYERLRAEGRMALLERQGIADTVDR